MSKGKASQKSHDASGWLNLRKLLPDSPDSAADMGLRCSLERVLSLTSGDLLWALRVEKRRQTKSGNEGVPIHVVTLVAHKGETPSDLLRWMADLYDAGEVPLNPEDLTKASAKAQKNLKTILDRMHA